VHWQEGLKWPMAREELTKVVAALEVSFFFPKIGSVRGPQQTLLDAKFIV